jgi:hypothetical protein
MRSDYSVIPPIRTATWLPFLRNALADAYEVSDNISHVHSAGLDTSITNRKASLVLSYSQKHLLHLY